MRHKLPTILLTLFIVAGMGVGSSASAGNGPGLREAMRAQERNSDRLLARSAIVGTAVGLTRSGTATILVLTTKPGVKVRSSLDGVPVTVKVTGALSAVHHRPGHSGGPGGGDPGDGGSDPSLSPTDRHPRPVPIGISTGNELECSAGTIGARVSKGGNVYALSNNHVYALENQAPVGSEILQPGLFDTGCSYSSSNVIGSLADYVPLRFDGSNNTVDAAIASTTTGNLGNATPSDGYGTPSSTTANPSVGMAVKKYGRTTGLTDGTITGINAIVNVGYSSGVARFVNQVIVESQRGPLLKSGDSGSLVVRSSGNAPVGLLFAGTQSGKLGVANDIDDVLSAFGASVG